MRRPCGCDKSGLRRSQFWDGQPPRFVLILALRAAPRRFRNRDTMHKTKIGLFGIGLDTYWPQFKGLKNRLVGYQKQITTRPRRSTTNET